MGTDSTLDKKKGAIFISVVFGLFFCLLLIYLIESIGHYFFPLPDKLSVNILEDIDIIREYVSKVPAIAMIFPLLSYFLGVCIGGFISNRISKRVYTSVIIGFIILILNIITLKTIPHPFWFIIVSNLIPLPSALLGGYLSKFYDLHAVKTIKHWQIDEAQS